MQRTIQTENKALFFDKPEKRLENLEIALTEGFLRQAKGNNAISERLEKLESKKVHQVYEQDVVLSLIKSVSELHSSNRENLLLWQNLTERLISLEEERKNLSESIFWCTQRVSGLLARVKETEDRLDKLEKPIKEARQRKLDADPISETVYCFTCEKRHLKPYCESVITKVKTESRDGLCVNTLYNEPLSKEESKELFPEDEAAQDLISKTWYCLNCGKRHLKKDNPFGVFCPKPVFCPDQK